MSNDQPQEARHQSGDPTLIAEFLLARIAEEEANWSYAGPSWALADHILRECEAKRRIVELHSGIRNGWNDDAGESMQSCEHDWKNWPCPTLCALAVVYSDHPDYRDEWRP